MLFRDDRGILQFIPQGAIRVVDIAFLLFIHLPYPNAKDHRDTRHTGAKSATCPVRSSARASDSAKLPESASEEIEFDIDEDVPGELVLLGMDSEGARDELVRFLDRAFAASRSSVRIVHGHGTGALRRVVSETCRTHPAVRSFRHPPQHLGGSGATEVSLEVSDHG